MQGEPPTPGARVPARCSSGSILVWPQCCSQRGPVGTLPGTGLGKNNHELVPTSLPGVALPGKYQLGLGQLLPG